MFKSLQNFPLSLIFYPNEWQKDWNVFNHTNSNKVGKRRQASCRRRNATMKKCSWRVEFCILNFMENKKLHPKKDIAQASETPCSSKSKWGTYIIWNLATWQLIDLVTWQLRNAETLQVEWVFSGVEWVYPESTTNSAQPTRDNYLGTTNSTEPTRRNQLGKTKSAQPTLHN